MARRHRVFPARLQHELIDLGRQRAVGVIVNRSLFQVGAEARRLRIAGELWAA